MLKNQVEDISNTQRDGLYGVYRGVIEDNNDSEKAGRCKVRVFGIHSQNKSKTNTDGIPTEELPWAEPVFGLFEGSVSGFGSWTVPLNGSHVMVFFEGGHPLEPRFFATVPGIPTEEPSTSKGFNDPDGEYPISEVNEPHQPNGLEEPDFNKLARGEGKDKTIVKSKNDNKDTGVKTALGEGNKEPWDEPDSYYSAEYPDNKVFSTRSGITIEIDDTDGEERVHIYHPSSSYIEIDKDGNMVMRNAKEKFEIIDENKKEHTMNDYDRTVDNNRSNRVGNDENEEIVNNRTREIGNDNDDTIKNKEYRHIKVDKEDTIDNDEIRNIGNNKEDTIGNDETRNIGNNKADTIGNNKTRTIGNNHTDTIANTENRTIGSNRTVTIGANNTLSISGNWNVTAGGACNITTTGPTNIASQGPCAITSSAICTITATAIALSAPVVSIG